MILNVFTSGPLDTNAYVVACEETGKAWVVDAPEGSHDEICSFIQDNKLTCDKIVLTHSHWDHIADVASLKESLRVSVAVHKEDEGNVVSPGSDGLPLYFSIKGVQPDEILHGQEELFLGNIKVRIIHTPGHSHGSICLYLQEHKCLISGDTLFQGSMGRIDLPTSDPEKMWSSLKMLAQLPKDLTVYPGHGDKTTIAKESWMAYAKELFS